MEGTRGLSLGGSWVSSLSLVSSKVLNLVPTKDAQTTELISIACLFWGSLWELVNNYKVLQSVTAVQEGVSLCGDEMLFKCVMSVTPSVPQGQPCSPFSPFHPCWGGQEGMCLT